MTSKRLDRIIALDKEYLFQNYGRLPVSFTRGKDDRLFDQDGREYIDFFSGIAVTNIGHGNPRYLKAVTGQLKALTHSSNWYYSQVQGEAAKMISDTAFLGKTLFVNSGTEANEAAIKLARRYGLSLHPKKIEIISFSGSFHGRTFGSMTATAQERIHNGFGPLPGGFTYLPFNDTKAFLKMVKKPGRIAAVFLEFIQGEGGIKIADEEFVKTISEKCREGNILLIADEVQTGAGRTGTPFAYQQYDIVPDILTLAKGLAGGLPVGALHAKSELALHFQPGTHGTTFGGNPVIMAGVKAVLTEISRESFMKKVRDQGRFIREEMEKFRKSCPIIREVRGKGLHIGIELDRPGLELVKRALNRGLVINCTAGNVIRIMPPLSVSPATVKKGLKILMDLFREECTTK